MLGLFIIATVLQPLCPRMVHPQNAVLQNVHLQKGRLSNVLFSRYPLHKTSSLQNFLAKTSHCLKSLTQLHILWQRVDKRFIVLGDGMSSFRKTLSLYLPTLPVLLPLLCLPACHLTASLMPFAACLTVVYRPVPSHPVVVLPAFAYFVLPLVSLPVCC
jgi:hypothetical protein